MPSASHFAPAVIGNCNCHEDYYHDSDYYRYPDRFHEIRLSREQIIGLSPERDLSGMSELQYRDCLEDRNDTDHQQAKHDELPVCDDITSQVPCADIMEQKDVCLGIDHANDDQADVDGGDVGDRRRRERTEMPKMILTRVRRVLVRGMPRRTGMVRTRLARSPSTSLMSNRTVLINTKEKKNRITASVTREGVAPETYIGRRAGGSAQAIATSRLLTTGISLSLRT